MRQGATHVFGPEPQSFESPADTGLGLSYCTALFLHLFCMAIGRGTPFLCSVKPSLGGQTPHQEIHSRQGPRLHARVRGKGSDIPWTPWPVERGREREHHDPPPHPCHRAQQRPQQDELRQQARQLSEGAASSSTTPTRPARRPESERLESSQGTDHRRCSQPQLPGSQRLALFGPLQPGDETHTCPNLAASRRSTTTPAEKQSKRAESKAARYTGRHHLDVQAKCKASTSPSSLSSSNTSTPKKRRRKTAGKRKGVSRPNADRASDDFVWDSMDWRGTKPEATKETKFEWLNPRPSESNPSSLHNLIAVARGTRT